MFGGCGGWLLRLGLVGVWAEAKNARGSKGTAAWEQRSRLGSKSIAAGKQISPLGSKVRLGAKKAIGLLEGFLLGFGGLLESGCESSGKVDCEGCCWILGKLGWVEVSLWGKLTVKAGYCWKLEKTGWVKLGDLLLQSEVMKLRCFFSSDLSSVDFLWEACWFL